MGMLDPSWAPKPTPQEQGYGGGGTGMLAPGFVPNQPTSQVDDITRSAASGARIGLEAIPGVFGDVKNLGQTAGSWLARRMGASEENIAKAKAEADKMGVIPGISATADPPSTSDIHEATTPIVGEGYEPKTDAGRYVQSGVSAVPLSLLTGGGGGFVRNTLMGLGGGMGGEAGGDIAEAMAPGNKTASTLGRIAGSIFGGGAFGGRTAAVKEAERETERGLARGATSDQLRTQARPLYDALDQAGVTYDSNQWGMMQQSLRDSLEGFHPSIQPKAAAALDDLERAGRGVYDRSVPPDLSLNRIQSARSLAIAAYKSGDAEERRIAGQILQSIDNFVDTVTPSGGNMAAPEVMQTWRDARDLWRRASKTEMGESVLNKAELQAASANSGGNLENATRQRVKSELNKELTPGRTTNYNAGETANMEAIVRGTDMQNRLRGFGNTYGGSGLSRMLQSGATSTPAVGAMLAFGQGNTKVGLGLAGTAVGSHLLRKAGEGARATSTRMAEDQADRWLRSMSSGQAVPPVANRQHLAELIAGPPTQEKLQLMIKLGLIPGAEDRANRRSE